MRTLNTINCRFRRAGSQSTDAASDLIAGVCAHEGKQTYETGAHCCTLQNRTGGLNRPKKRESSVLGLQSSKLDQCTAPRSTHCPHQKWLETVRGAFVQRDVRSGSSGARITEQDCELKQNIFGVRLPVPVTEKRTWLPLVPLGLSR
jgi:hypothetical protein